MPTQTLRQRKELPGAFEALVRILPPMAIQDDIQHGNTVEMIDRLMQIPSTSRGQKIYMETLVELVEAYEARHHALELSRISGRAMLRHTVTESGMSASDLARVLNVHASLGSKILNGERALTWSHAKSLARHFRLEPALFMD